MADTQCTVEGCDRPRRTRGMCNSHYQKLRRTGEIPTAPLREYRTEAVCEIEECQRPHHAQGYCQLHHRRLQEFGDPHRAKQMPAGPEHWNWAGTDVEYQAAHSRVYRKRGAASRHRCAHCDQPAANWAYDHEDPNELLSTVGKSLNCRYSGDPDHYLPLCVPCHVSFDAPVHQSA